MTVTTQYRDGKYTLIEFNITFPNGRILPLTPYCARADIYESVLEPTVIAEFVFYKMLIILQVDVLKEQKFIMEHASNMPHKLWKVSLKLRLAVG